jgi:hypothetical protein
MRHNGFFFPALRELAGKKSYVIAVRFEKLYIYQTGISLPGRFIDARAGNFGQIIDGKIIDLMMPSIRPDLVAKMAGRAKEGLNKELRIDIRHRNCRSQ